ncbi:hypothetical protein [Nocardioides sp. CER19]|uniref:hypothetical protein n=1 Tax=Nocardioides sp. CER19 TaxID=3038538 RepID=UPI0024494265|nr:hypothetical protein [Nocardioides sp. CER19]MDH2414848.1 hypothetical protein [Nocardioides sp. CER19]
MSGRVNRRLRSSFGVGRISPYPAAVVGRTRVPSHVGGTVPGAGAAESVTAGGGVVAGAVVGEAGDVVGVLVGDVVGDVGDAGDAVGDPGAAVGSLEHPTTSPKTGPATSTAAASAALFDLTCQP